MKVTVTKGIRVVAPDGRVYETGEPADVPERVARQWIHCGWANDSRTPPTLPDPRGLASGLNRGSKSRPDKTTPRVDTGRRSRPGQGSPTKE
jgi:hypothetical protein